MSMFVLKWPDKEKDTDAIRMFIMKNGGTEAEAQEALKEVEDLSSLIEKMIS